MRSSKQSKKLFSWAWVYITTGEWFTTYYQTNDMIAAGGDALSLGGTLLLIGAVMVWVVRSPLRMHPPSNTKRRNSEKNKEEVELEVE